jgi:fructose-specific phosphotransferase system IIC component
MVITRHPYRAVGVVLAVMAISAFVAGMIGQYNDGPWGGLPEWLGAVSWFTFLGSVLAILVLSAYLAYANLRYRKERAQPRADREPASR